MFLFQSKGSFDSCYYSLYVDDMLLVDNDTSEVVSIKQKLKLEFEMKDLGPIRRRLGMEIKRNKIESMIF